MFLRGGRSTEGEVDFLEEYIFDLRGQVGQSHQVLPDFGGRHGFGEVEG